MMKISIPRRDISVKLIFVLNSEGGGNRQIQYIVEEQVGQNHVLLAKINGLILLKFIPYQVS
ncbi:MAG: hypothetical protein V3U02_05715 [Calditrichia bacterium]